LIFSYKIYQIKHLFDDFKKVYSGTIEAASEIDALEKLYEIFNMSHPPGFKGRSLSVGDIVRLGEKVYYCATAGWKEF
jgi:hypothetical protein